MICMNCLRVWKMIGSLCRISYRSFGKSSLSATGPCAKPWSYGTQLAWFQKPHALKGMLSNMAAGEAAAASAELERLGRNKETAKFHESFANFENIAKELSRQVAAYIDKKVCG